MIEVFFVVYLLSLFIFPAQILSGTAAVGTHFYLYQRYRFFKRQPKPGKKVFYLALISRTANLAISFMLATGLSLLVHQVIYDLVYLFYFNFLLCFLISARWFDFTHAFFRKMILKLNPSLPETGSAFVMYQGYRKGAGLGAGLTPLFMDAGMLSWGDDAIRFDGVFIKRSFTRENAPHAIRKSSDRIVLDTGTHPHPLSPDKVTIILRDRFYPFQCRELRNEIHKVFANLQPKQNSPAQDARQYVEPGKIYR